jgi:hypothetical protein
MMRKLLVVLMLAGGLFAQNPETAVFPGAVAADVDLLVAKDSAWSTLNGNINASTLTVVVVAGSHFAYPSVAIINSEMLKVCSISSNTLTICTGGRGFAGTTPAAHSSGALVQDFITAKHHNLTAAEVKAIETALGASLANVYHPGGTDVQIPDGGTGASTKAAAFDALSPLSALGDLVYGATAGTGTRLAGNITAAKQFLCQTGTGTVSAAPAWCNIIAADVPTLNQSTSGNAGTATALAANGANCSAGSYPLGVNASGAVEDCTAVPAAGAPTTAHYLTTQAEAGLSAEVSLGALADNNIVAVDIAASVATVRAAIAGDVVLLFGNGSCSGYLKSDGTCDVSTVATGMTQATANSADNTVSVSVGTSGRAFEKTPVTIDPSTGAVATPDGYTAGNGSDIGALDLLEGAIPTTVLGTGHWRLSIDSTLYHVWRWSGTTAVDLEAQPPVKITAVFSGANLVTGAYVFTTMEDACTLDKVTLLTDATFTGTVDFKKVAFASWAGTGSGTSMIGSGVKPVVTAGVSSQDVDLSDWATRALAVNDVFELVLSGVTAGSATQLTVVARCSR